MPGVDEVDVEGLRQPEMAIEVSEYTLRKYNLTFDDVVNAIRRSSINLPGGAIRAEGGDITLRTFEQAYVADDFAAHRIAAQPGRHPRAARRRRGYPRWLRRNR